MSLLIGSTETDDFLHWCRRTISQRSTRNSIRPYDEVRDALVFSFDVELNLFLGNHYGQNPPTDKTFFQKTPTIMYEMSQIALAFGRQSGGRVFIDNKRYYFVDRSPRVIKLCDLTWPKGMDVVGEVRKSWLELPLPSHMTIRLPQSRKVGTRVI
jgi:hypothetical protein